jgi:two-component system response regulator WspF
MKIGIVDDTAMARETLRTVVSSVPGHQVAWIATNGAEAIDRARTDTPDLILMDLVMPGVDGVEATRRIMQENPCAILVVTASVTSRVRKVYEAMGYGALDAVDTPTLGPHGDLRGASALLWKIETIGKLIAPAPGLDTGPPIPMPARHRAGSDWLVGIGASTGGPAAVTTVLSAFPRNFSAIVVIVQHIDEAMAQGMADVLSQETGHRVEVAEPGMVPRSGQILLAKTDDHLVLDRNGSLNYVAEPRDAWYRPSADVFFRSIASNWRQPGVAVLLTGMGRDGASGLLGLRRAGWLTIAQDEETCVVWGMPGAAAKIGAAERILPVSQIGPAIVGHIEAHSPRAEYNI